MELEPICITAIGGLVSALVYMFKKYTAARDRNVELMERAAADKDDMVSELKRKNQELEDAIKTFSE